MRTKKSELAKNGLSADKGVVILEAACLQDVGGLVKVGGNMLCKMCIRSNRDDLAAKLFVTF